jgi:hypothetical protein
MCGGVLKISYIVLKKDIVKIPESDVKQRGKQDIPELKKKPKYTKLVNFKTYYVIINNSVFSFASSAYSTVCYSDNILDILQTYRSKVDDYLVRSGFKEHLDAVRAGLSSDNPQEWRNNMLGCRNIIRDLAGHLWRDPRDTYIYLPGSGKDGKLPVTEDKYVNRLGAYLLHP